MGAEGCVAKHRMALGDGALWYAIRGNWSSRFQRKSRPSPCADHNVGPMNCRSWTGALPVFIPMVVGDEA